MTQFSNDDQRNKHISAILFAVTFLIHFAWTTYASSKGNFVFIVDIKEIISSAFYSTLGFEWKGNGAYLVSAALVSSCITNTVRQFLEGVFLGWPRYKKHDKSNLTRAALLLISYSAMTYFAIGFFGEKYSSKSLDAINIFLIATSTYIAGLLVDLIDEFISSLYCIQVADKA